MITSSALLADLKRQLAALERDLRAQSEDPEVEWAAALRTEHAHATQRGRTAQTWSVWRDGEVSQAAVAWIVATTFLRFCEDNHLLDGLTAAGLGGEPVWIAGPGERTDRAVENQQAHYEQRRTDNSRDWLHRALGALADLPAGRDLVDRRHNPVWRAPISAPAADALLAFWRAKDDAGSLVHDFTDADLGTRFLGDLYQDLSEHAKKTFALLQTPVFVEEFILDRTLTPAIEEFGLEGLKLIDPTCGSGHFLLGAFARLDEAWQAKAPALTPRERVQKALDSIHGVDLNPFAVAIARFRLTTAALKASGDATLTAAPSFRYHLAVGDSLLGAQGVADTSALFVDEEPAFSYASEDLADHPGVLAPGRYHVVVGNPPYIQVKDKALSDLYRKGYPTCSGKYALSVPFMELFFRLARRQSAEGGAGFVGKITSNSFMKREFGKKLIEQYLSGRDIAGIQSNPVDLLDVIDTSGAYIPGHGTPTVILVGRPRRPTGSTVKAALGVRGEPGQPADPAHGLVWSEITTHIDDATYDGTYVTITALDRETLSSHPWSLAGGGASDLKQFIEERSAASLGAVADGIGIMAVLGEEEAYELPRWSTEPSRPMVIGEDIRDFALRASPRWWPYDARLDVSSAAHVSAWMWRFRRTVRGYLMFGKTREERGLNWFEYGMLARAKLKAPLSITFAFVATHNHFVLDRGGKVFNRSAPVIKLAEGATEDEHLALLGVLNSSTACFWLKQVSHNKGSQSGTGGFMHDEWEEFYEFTGTKLQEFPLPSRLSAARGSALDDLAKQAAAHDPCVTLDRPDADAAFDIPAGLAAARETYDSIRARMVFEQEELDWDTYRLYGLIDTDLTYSGSQDSLRLGERAFEIVLAGLIESGGEESVWFERHGSTPITSLPEQWPADYREVMERRLAEIESNPHIRLLERPEYKRRWAGKSWDELQDEALRAAALDRLEQASLWRDAHGAVTLSVGQLADRTRDDAVLHGLLEALTGTAHYDVVPTLTQLLKEESVPYLAAHRLKEQGITKFREWQHVWDLQRREDAGEQVQIPVPPKYAPADFRSTPAWRARGKLDVPKERFIAYPGVSRSGDSSPVLGWAGWDHAEQAQALARAVLDTRALGGDDEAVAPLVAGLVELEPWLHQWHAEVDPSFGGSPAQAITAMIDDQLTTLGRTRPDLDAWRPTAATRGRRPRTEAQA